MRAAEYPASARNEAGHQDNGEAKKRRRLLQAWPPLWYRKPGSAAPLRSAISLA